MLVLPLMPEVYHLPCAGSKTRNQPGSTRERRERAIFAGLLKLAAGQREMTRV